jgi:hypothetical protein
MGTSKRVVVESQNMFGDAQGVNSVSAKFFLFFLFMRQ